MTHAQLLEDGAIVKPLGDGSWAWFPYGDLGPGFVLDEAQRARLQRQRRRLGYFALCAVLGGCALILYFPSLTEVPSLGGFWIGLVLFVGVWLLIDHWMVALHPKAPVRLSRAEAVEMSAHRISNASLWYLAAIGPVLLLLVGWGSYHELSKGMLGDVTQAQMGIVFIAAHLCFVPRLIAIAARKWPRWWMRLCALILSLASIGATVLLIHSLSA